MGKSADELYEEAMAIGAKLLEEAASRAGTMPADEEWPDVIEVNERGPARQAWLNVSKRNRGKAE